MNKQRLIPLIVATALFMENMDSTVIATSLPAIAADIGTSPLTLKLAITSYLLSLAVFIPASGWTADRFGARMVFAIAIGVFMLGSIGCALSSSVTHFVIARILQGLGGAMMTPVGGFITTYFSWHWIFLINIPIGLLGIVLALRYIDPIKSEDPERFDLYGLMLAGIGLGGIAFGLSIAGLNLVPWTVVIALVAIGTISMTLYVIHARRTASPVLDFALLRLPTMRASIIGGFLFRLGIGSLPFLLPLLMQVGFGLSPLRFPQHHDHQRGGEFDFPRGLRAVHHRNAAAADHDPACGRRLLPFAAVHRHQHAGICRSRAGADEPRHHAGQRQPATGCFRRRRRRRVLGGVDHAAASCQRAQRCRFRAGVHRGVGDLGDFGVLLLRDARECRSSGIGTRSSRGPPGARRRTGGDRRCRDRQRQGSAAGVIRASVIASEAKQSTSHIGKRAGLLRRLRS